MTELEKKINQMGLLVHKLREWAETTPEKTFFYYGEEDRHLTYNEFNKLANCVANNLRVLGVDKGDRVSLFLSNPLITMLAMFGLWKIGAIFCPINFHYKGSLLSYQLNDTKPKMLITESGQQPFLNEIKSEIASLPIVIYRPKQDQHDFRQENDRVFLDKEFTQIPFDEFLVGDDSDPDADLNYWDTANIIYTSGTTGQPKGVVQSNRWLQNYCYYAIQFLHPEDIIYCDLPLYHVGGAFSLVGRAAWRGCTVAVWDRFSASDYWNRIRVSEASYTLLLDVVMPWLLKSEAKVDDCNNSLRRVHMQPLPDYHHQFAERFGIDFVNVGYGATEFGCACAALIDESVDGERTPKEIRKGYSRSEIINIAHELGMPVVPGNMQIHKGFMGVSCMHHEVTIVDKHDTELGPGAYGEIVVRSNLPYLLMNEYFNNPEATAEVSKNLWLHTGDGAYKDENGMFYFVDRLGGFIRVRGENISSQQIEDIVNSHQKVELCAVFSVEAEEGLEDDIIVYIVPDFDKKLSEEEFRAWAKTKMPKYMCPKHIRFIETLPQTPTHKIEKYKLKEMFLSEKRRGLTIQ